MIVFVDVDTPLLNAIREGDISTLRQLAFTSGGYRSNEIRKKVWPLLLGANTDVTLLDEKGQKFRTHTF